MIRIERVSFTYENAGSGGRIEDIDLCIKDGQVVLLCGESGSGKTTFSRLINGLIPAYYEGELTGNVYIDELCVNSEPLYKTAARVGSVFQNPKSQFYTLLADTEIVFACENLGLPREEILSRFDETVGAMHIEKLLGRNLFRMSGGEKQRIACASVDAVKPDVLVLDEPTSNLDMAGMADLRKIISDWKQAGKTVIISEHRLAWLKGLADRVIVFENGRIREDLPAVAFWAKGTEELHKAGLRAPFDLSGIRMETKDAETGRMVFRAFTHKYKKAEAESLSIDELSVPEGKVVAVLGDNGAGKSTFARCLCGLEKKCAGTVNYRGKNYKARDRIDLCYMVMQDVNHQLFTQSVLEETILGSETGKQEDPEAAAEEVLKQLDLLDYKELHPMSLSGGQRQRVAIASAVASGRDVIVYDEPTSGLDYRHMLEVAGCIRNLANTGRTQFIITHDAELVAECCDYYLFIGDGKVVRSGGWDDEAVKYVSGYFNNVTA